jgi:hypothetical protein
VPIGSPGIELITRFSEPVRVLVVGSSELPKMKTRKNQDNHGMDRTTDHGSVDEAKDYAMREILRRRRKDERLAVRVLGNTVLNAIVASCDDCHIPFDAYNALTIKTAS